MGHDNRIAEMRRAMPLSYRVKHALAINPYTHFVTGLARVIRTGKTQDFQLHGMERFDKPENLYGSRGPCAWFYKHETRLDPANLVPLAKYLRARPHGQALSRTPKIFKEWIVIRGVARPYMIEQEHGPSKGEPAETDAEKKARKARNRDRIPNDIYEGGKQLFMAPEGNTKENPGSIKVHGRGCRDLLFRKDSNGEVFEVVPWFPIGLTYETIALKNPKKFIVHAHVGEMRRYVPLSKDPSWTREEWNAHDLTHHQETVADALVAHNTITISQIMGDYLLSGEVDYSRPIPRGELFEVLEHQVIKVAKAQEASIDRHILDPNLRARHFIDFCRGLERLGYGSIDKENDIMFNQEVLFNEPEYKLFRRKNPLMFARNRLEHHKRVDPEVLEALVLD